jgi:hypothetical protein
MIKTLLSGCSLSDWCGFGPTLARGELLPLALIGNHDNPQCWYNIVKQRFDLDLTNVSYGGFSNEEILNKTCKEIAINSYELVIIQLTSTQRKWFYRADNPFEFCLAHGANTHNKTEQEMFNYFRVYFNNELIEIENTLSMLILIQNYLLEKNIPLILINGANFVHCLQQLLDRPEKYCQERIPSDVWELKGILYAKELHRLASSVDLNCFANLDTSLKTLQIDLADDNHHPGVQSNIVYADIVGKKLSKILSK